MNGTRDWIIPENWANGVNTVEGSLPKRPTVSNNYKATVVPQYLRLIPAGSIFNSISYQFSTSWRHTDRPRPLVRYIYKILSVNRASENAHRAYADRIENEQRLWHATVRRCQLGDDGQGLQLCADEQCSLCQIIRTSFKKKFSLDSGMFGKGIYVSSTSSKAAGYSQNSQPSNYKAILLNNVVVGRAYETNEPMQGRTAPPAGYDSVCGLPGTALKFDETCVYDDDAIRPTYLILYDVGKP
ncbi:ADP-ribosylation [Roridomyces roridus]|uniref:ADP-ribosylation n=1 Tax=Roridomyces roridus TaxID=1738132 RepID=A0AAD7BLN4_9AGAR|nr:ADP-ribosylation [Roridomyces roridus]